MATGNYKAIDFQYSNTDASFQSAIRFVVVDDTAHGGQIEFFTDNSSGTNTKALTLDKSQNATFTGDIYGNDRLYLGTKMALDVNGTDLYLGSTTSANHNDTVYIRTNDANRVAIDDSGRVLINQGSNLTSQILQVNGMIDQVDVTKALRIYDGSTFVGGIGSGQWAFSATYATDYSLYAQNNLLFHAGTGSSIDMMINGSHNVGINTTSPITKLDVNGAGSTGTISWANDAGRKRGYLYSDSAGVAIYSTALSTAGIYLADSAQIDFRLGGSIKMLLNSSGSLTVSGDLVAYGSPSDKRLKENIKPIKNPLGKIKKLKGVTFDWKKSENILDIKEDYGFIAQDVQKVIPELIRKNENELLSMRHQGVIPILVEAIKELEARVKELENK